MAIVGGHSWRRFCFLIQTWLQGPTSTVWIGREMRIQMLHASSTAAQAGWRHPLGVKRPCCSCLVREGAFPHGFREQKRFKCLRAPVNHLGDFGRRREDKLFHKPSHLTHLKASTRVSWFWSNSLILSSQMPHKTGHISQWPCKDSHGNQLKS